ARRRLPLEGVAELREHARFRLRLDDDAARIVGNPAGDTERTRQSVDERPVADALNRTPDEQAQSLRLRLYAGCSASCWSSADSHASTPSPVRAETRKIGTVGLTMRTPCSNASKSNANTSARSYLLSATRSAFAYMPGYLNG